MADASSLLLLVIFHLSLLSWAEDVTGFNPKCPSLPCGNLGNISFPFTSRTHPECGLFMLDNCDKPYPQKIQLGKDGPSFYISYIKQDNGLVLSDQADLEHRCGLYQNFTLSSSPFYSFELPFKSTIRCPGTHNSNLRNFTLSCIDSNYSIIYYNQTTHDVPPTPAGCSVIQSQVTKTPKHVFFRNIYTGWLYFQVNVTEECYDCYWRGGQCQSDSNGNFKCTGAKIGNRNKTRLGLKLGFGIGGPVLLIVALSIYITRRRRKGIYASPNSRFTSFDPSSKSDLEAAGAYFGVPIFSYSELAEATNNFNHEKELGDGGFGTVYYDFGLSRLFPTDVTHVSTAPQGTPGYVDPEYHQCYQLTDKSDVYSFGVVLIELISSMPAVDISRHRNEINLANLAINKIQKHAVDELVDPCLGFHSDEEVKRTATSVAELAFLCLQQIKEMRPSMDVVLEELHRIKSGECKSENLTREDDDTKELKSMQQPPPSPPHCEESALLKNIMLPPSPISVTENWISNDTTPTVSN